MLVLCGRRSGLVCSITRLVHFGTLSEDLHHRVSATAQVNATLIAGSRPERRLSDVLAEAQRSYANVGFPTEWQQHHQGGIAGYEPREILATPTSTEVIVEGQVVSLESFHCWGKNGRYHFGWSAFQRIIDTHLAMACDVH